MQRKLAHAQFFLPKHVERKHAQNTPPAASAANSTSCVVAAPSSRSATNSDAASTNGGGNAGGNADRDGYNSDLQPFKSVQKPEGYTKPAPTNPPQLALVASRRFQ